MIDRFHQIPMFDAGERHDPSAAMAKNPARPTDTQVEAAARVLPHTGTARRRVLDAIQSAGSSGMTDDELVAALEMNPNTERPRRKELVEMGWVRDSGLRRDTAGGSKAIVWAAF